MALYGSDPALWRGPKIAFVLEADALAARFGVRRLLFVPSEGRGLLRPLLYQRLAAKQGIPRPPSGLGVVRINGAFRGLYHFEAYAIEADPATRQDVPFPDALARLPLAGVDPVREYEALRRELEPLLARDGMAAWSARRLRYELRRDRERLRRWAARADPRNDESAVRQVSGYLQERLVLNGNPAASFVVGDLALGVIDAPTVGVTWTSSQPSLIDPHGRVARPPSGGPVRVALTAAITSGQATGEKILEFTVMPTLKIPVLRLVVPGTVRDSHRTPCRVELIEDSPLRRTGWRACGIKLRGNTSLWQYPKPLYSLRTTEPHAFFDFSDSRVLYLIGPYPDASLIKNKIAYDLFRSLGDATHPRYSPRVRLVELFVNDEYQGVYQFMERVDRFMFPLNGNGAAAGDVIYKAVDRHEVFSTLRTDAFVQVEPDAERGPYWTPLEELTRFTSQPRTTLFRQEIGQWIDLPTFADYHILVNLLNHNEGQVYNFFLVRGAGTDGRFVIVPWDFDKALGGSPEVWRSNFLFDRLLQQVPEYKTMLKARWGQLRRAQLETAALEAMVDRLAEELGPSVPREFERWPRRGMPDHRQVIAEMKTWLRQRVAFLDRFVARL
jgi:hypothetical protein